MIRVIPTVCFRAITFFKPFDQQKPHCLYFLSACFAPLLDSVQRIFFAVPLVVVGMTRERPLVWIAKECAERAHKSVFVGAFLRFHFSTNSRKAFFRAFSNGCNAAEWSDENEGLFVACAVRKNNKFYWSFASVAMNETDKNARVGMERNPKNRTEVAAGQFRCVRSSLTPFWNS